MDLSQTLPAHRLEIRASEPGPKIDPLLYGIFWEELDFAGDGGIYAELVRNWNFEADPAEPLYWTAIQTEGASGSISLDTSVRLNECQTHSLRVDVLDVQKNGRFAVSNEGYWGIPVENGTAYRLSFFARSEGAIAPSIRVTLEDASGNVVYGSVSIEEIRGEWGKYSATITANGDDPNGRLVLTFKQTGTVWLDIVSLFPPTYPDSLGVFRNDLVTLLKEMKPAFMRFPGGCYIQGFTGIDQAFDWKKSIGPIEMRQGMYIMWSYFATGAMGYHEMLQLSEHIGAEPIYVCNCGQTMNESVPDHDLDRWIQTALDAIEYANGPVTSQWGIVRAANGHPEPFNMKIVQIGNEDAVPRFQADYDRHYFVFRQAILDRYPDMKIVQSVNQLTDDPEWNGQPADYLDHHFYRSPDWFFNNASKYDNYPRSEPAVFLGEVASMSPDVGEGNLWGAIGEAAFLTGAERNADVVKLATYAPLLRNVNWRNWNPNMIMFDNTRSYGIPSYYLWKIFMENTGDTYLPSSISDNLHVKHITLEGAVGVGTWGTSAEFKDISVTDRNGQSLADDFTDTSLWKQHRGDWELRDGVFAQSSLETRCWFEFLRVDTCDYIYRLRAKKVSGSEGFQIPFSVNDGGGFIWNIGGWENNRSSIMRTSGEQMLEVGQSVPIEVETGRWYDLQIDVHGDVIHCSLDGQVIHEYTVEPVTTPILFASVNRDTLRGDLIIKLVNTSAQARTTNISISGVTDVVDQGTVIVLANDDPTIENSFEEPYRVVPVTRVINNISTTFEYEAPAYSINVLRLKEKN